MKVTTKLFLFLVLFVFGNAMAQNVYITNTGKKYHKAGCRYLKNSSTEINTKEAIDKGYTPCKVCKPTSSNTITDSKEKKTSKEVSGQCTALTKKGIRCKRKASTGSSRCWQHK